MAPFAPHPEELDDRGTTDLLVEIPLVSTKKHIAEDDSTEIYYDSEDWSLSPSVSSATFVKNIWDFNACVAITERIALCSNNSTTNTVSSHSTNIKVHNCIECGAGIDKKELGACEKGTNSIPVHIDCIDTSEQGEEVDIDGLVNMEPKRKCHGYPQIKQSEMGHARSYKSVLRELFVYFGHLKGGPKYPTTNSEESGQFEESTPGCVDREPMRKKKRPGKLGPGSIRKVISKSLFSMQKFMSDQKGSKSTLQSIDQAEKEKSCDIQTIYSSPTSLQYRFKKSDDANSAPGVTKRKSKGRSLSLIQRVKNEYSNIKRRRTSEYSTRVRTVAVHWS